MSGKTYINDNGTWRTVRKIFINDGGTWRTVRNQWVKDASGNWRLVHTNAFTYSNTIVSNTANYNLRTVLTSEGWNGTDDVEATITIAPGVTVYSTSTPTAAFTINPALPAGSSVTLINQGTIVGKAGNGGAGGPSVGGAIPTTSASNGSTGNPGGIALRVASPITINNTNGTIAGGGGGGGGGGGASGFVVQFPTAASAVVGGSGGGGGGGSASGLSPSPGGSGGIATNPNSPTTVHARSNGSAGNAGTVTAGSTRPGVPVTGIGAPGSITSIGGLGGAGGARGSNGGNGGSGAIPTSSPAPGLTKSIGSGASGGSTGAAISGNPFVTLPTPQLGTISGPRV